jgi:hypothetical protein
MTTGDAFPKYVAASSAVNGPPNRKPCATGQPSRVNWVSCSSVSTPSATTFSRSEVASDRIARTTSTLEPPRCNCDTNERSIFTVSIGSLARRLSDE